MCEEPLPACPSLFRIDTRRQQAFPTGQGPGFDISPSPETTHQKAPPASHTSGCNSPPRPDLPTIEQEVQVSTAAARPAEAKAFFLKIQNGAGAEGLPAPNIKVVSGLPSVSTAGKVSRN